MFRFCCIFVYQNVVVVAALCHLILLANIGARHGNDSTEGSVF